MQHIPFDLEVYRSRISPFIDKSPNGGLFWEALDFAVEAHDDQWRKSGDAYILHPCSVAKILAEEMDVIHPEILAAALLHDTVEDVEEVTVDLVKEKFGSYVAAIVEGCTKVTHSSGDKQNQSKLVHRKIFSGAAMRPEVILVKLADRLHNLRTLKAMPKAKRQRISDETIDIYAPLATILGLYGMRREMYNLALLYRFPKQGAKLNLHLEQLKQSPVALEIIAELTKAMDDAWLNCDVSMRVKGLWAYYDTSNRILRKEIDNPIEVVMIVDDQEVCYQALGIVNQAFPPIPRTIRDFIANPKPTGYQGLHSRVVVQGKEFLIKIRTQEMARKAQRGLFKNWTSKSDKQGRFIREIMEMFDLLSSDATVSYREMINVGRKKTIYTYTPRGDLIYLPINSIVLDFAFKVHTEIGHRCIGGMVGNKKVDPEYRLKDGDVVRIIRSENVVQFDQKMVGVCQDPRARSELSKALRNRRRPVSIHVGESTLVQEIKNYGYDEEVLQRKDIAKLFKEFSIKSLDDLYVNIAESKIPLAKVIDFIKNEYYGGQSFLMPPTGKINRVVLTTLDPVSIKLSSCCRPDPTAKVSRGLLTENGLSIHNKDCEKLKELEFQREDALDVSWKLRATTLTKKQSIYLLRLTRQRVTTLVSSAPEAMRMFELSMLTLVPTKTPDWQLDFKVDNLYGLRQVLKHFEKSKVPFEIDFNF